MAKKKQIKPSEYPERMLKLLVKEYDIPENASVRSPGMDFAILVADAGIVEDYKIDDEYGDFFPEAIAALGLMEKAGWAERRGLANDLRVLPTVEGLRHGRWLLLPWHRKAWDAIKSDVRTAFWAILTAIIITIVTTLILKMIGW